MVYVISQEGIPLMPTEKHGMVRHFLKEGLAKVVRRKPFTIQLQYRSKTYTQPVTYGIDSGYSYVGYSAVANKKELISGVLTLLKDMSERLKKRRDYRRLRRTRLRYRKSRFDNRKKPDGWLAPSIQHKFDSHIRFINLLRTFLPLTTINIEVGNFDTQKIKDPNISGVGYQNGEQKDFFNLREYILYRDNYKCQLCGRDDLPLVVHHIGYWKGDRTNRPDNLITLCTQCHSPANHAQNGKLYGMKSVTRTLKEATFMSTVKQKLANELSKTFNVNVTYGYETKAKRIALGLDKTHYNDAFVIAGGTKDHKRVEPINFVQTRRNNRSLEKFYDAKYVDTRTGKVASGKELFNGRTTRNKKLNTENLHKYRGLKKSAGQRRIRKQHYFYQAGDLVWFNGKVYKVKSNEGGNSKYKYISLVGSKKYAKPNQVKIYKFRRGICVDE
jgi:hypothetical protein